MVTARRKIDFDLFILSLYSNPPGISAASQKELEDIEKQRAGSIGSLDHEIRKIKTELYHDDARKKELTYLHRNNNQPEHNNNNTTEHLHSSALSTSSTNNGLGVKRKSVKKKRRINTKDAAHMERQRLVYMVGKIKGITLFDEENMHATIEPIVNSVQTTNNTDWYIFGTSNTWLKRWKILGFFHV